MVREAIPTAKTGAPVLPRESLREQAGRAAQRVNATATPAVLSVSAPVPESDPLAWLSVQSSVPRIYWRSPRGEDFAGAGSAHTIKCPPVGTMRRAADDAAAFLEEHIIARNSPLEIGPRFVGGFAFDPAANMGDLWDDGGFTTGALVLPEALLVRRQGVAQIILSLRVEPGVTANCIVEDLTRLWNEYERGMGTAVPAARHEFAAAEATDPEKWCRAVRKALAEIADGRMEKVVLARCAVHALPHGADPLAVLGSLRAAEPDCYQFAFQWNAESVYVGSTPERLFQSDGRMLESECIAGTIRRGRDAAEDELLATALLSSTKDRLEHSYVVEAVLGDLEALCERIDAAPEPRIMKLATLQHLTNRIVGRLRDETTVGAILERLHPTPAVGGWPRARALAAIRELEDTPRGWYGGPVGWIAAGEAEFAVAIRSAILSENTAHLFAGAGIVSGSEPESEWQETEDKLNAFIRAVNGSS